jgi:hypothetical protein
MNIPQMIRQIAAGNLNAQLRPSQDIALPAVWTHLPRSVVPSA